MKRALIGRENFETSIGQGEQAHGKVMEAYQRKKEYLVLGEGERRRMNV
jgi:hypothetical protein